MGYTYGRERNVELLKKEALKYKTRSEFAKADCSLYTYAARHNLLDDVCQHMRKIRGGFSVPQYICKIVLDYILEDNGMYNTRKIISPHEIDIYYPQFKLAIEYNGRRWHSEKISPVKNNKLKNKSINLIVIEQGECPSFFQDYMEHIKKDIILKLDEINRICNKNISPEQIENIVINFYDIPFNIDWDEIESFVKTCESKSDLYRKNNSYYRLILKFNKDEMITYLENKRKDHIRNKSQEKIKLKLALIKNNYYSYREVVRDKKMYDFVKRNNLIAQVKNLFIF